MINRDENRFNFIGRILFMVFFLCIICIQSNKSEKNTFFHSQYEVITELHAVSGNAICVDFIQAPILQKSLITLSDKIGFSLFNQSFKLTADNSRFAQRITLLQKSLLTLKPIDNASRFYYHLFAPTAQEPPLLS